MLIKCPECGHQVSDQAKTCPSCGIEIAGKITWCPDCGEVIFKEQPFCPNCHCSINGASAEAQPPAAVPQPKASQQEAAAPEKVPAPRRPRKRRAGVTALIVAFVLALIVVFLGIYFMKNQEQQNERRAYENALRSNEPLVLQNFLDMYGDAPLAHRDTVQMHLEMLKKIDSDWAEAVMHNSKTALERYMKLHPQSIHNVEARIKVDSLDWVEAGRANTAEAYQQYMAAHEDGAYYDEARSNFERLEAQKVTDEDRLMVSQLFASYFNAIAQMDETALTATLAPVLTSFLHRQNATKEDVMQYMQKIHAGDVTGMEFTPNRDFNIEKTDLGDGRYRLNVTFTAVQLTRHGEADRPARSTTYKVMAHVSPEGRISELNMRREVAAEKAEE